jgi:tetratricopeptide (TPR) repeat protein
MERRNGAKRLRAKGGLYCADDPLLQLPQSRCRHAVNIPINSATTSGRSAKQFCNSWGSSTAQAPPRIGRLAKRPNDAEIYFRLAETYSRLRQYDKAEMATRNGLVINPQNDVAKRFLRQLEESK